MRKYEQIFKRSKSVIAMIHVAALPGTPRNNCCIKSIVAKARVEARAYAEAGITAVMIENMHDAPYLKVGVGPEIVAGMTAVALAVKEEFSGKPVGIQILAGANKQALAVAQAANLDFIRAEGFVFGHLADEGYFDACAGELLRYRKMIGAENIAILTDIKKKHSAHALTADVSIAETAKAAEFFLSDGVIVTGPATGCETNLEELAEVKRSVNIPVLVGSGVTCDNLEKYYDLADALIIGSYFKANGFWKNRIDQERLQAFKEKLRELEARSAKANLQARFLRGM
jgi:uncharacterized protein